MSHKPTSPIVLDAVPFQLNPAELIEVFKLETIQDIQMAEFEALVAQAKKIAKPKAMYKFAHMSIHDDTKVKIESEIFHSKMLSLNLSGLSEVFPYVATCGAEIEAFSKSYLNEPQSVWCHAIKMSLLSSAYRYLLIHLQETYGIVGPISNMTPGASDEEIWPIDDLEKLFHLFGNTEEKIGVSHIADYLMEPSVSVAGILFPKEETYVNCQVCHRSDCTERTAPFDQKLWFELIEM